MVYIYRSPSGTSARLQRHLVARQSGRTRDFRLVGFAPAPAAGCIMSATSTIPLHGTGGPRPDRPAASGCADGGCSSALVGGGLMLLPDLWVLVTSFLPSSMQFNLPPVWFTTTGRYRATVSCST